MKLVRQHIDKSTTGGTVELLPETVEDMWQVYNLIVPGDRVQGVAFRKVTREGAAGGTSSVERVKMRMTVAVTSSSFDQETGGVRVHGRNVEALEHVRAGAHQTLDLEVHRPVVITKDAWDAQALSVVRQVTKPGVDADLAVILLEPGSADILLVTASLTLPRAKVDVSVPAKRAGSDRHASGMGKFYTALTAAVARSIDFTAIKVVVMASAGFLKEDAFAAMMATAASAPDTYKGILENRDKFVLAHAPSGHRRSLVAILSDPALTVRLGETKLAGETRLLARFFEALATDSDRVHYGWRHVRVAVDRGAVQTLLLCDGLFRSRVPGVREAYAALSADVAGTGGNVHVFSTHHPSGEQLASMGGVAALLRYPLPEMDMEDALRAMGAAGPGGEVHPQAKKPHVTAQGGGEEGEAAPEPDLEADSDGSSDSDASYKKPGYTGPLRSRC